MKNCRKYSDKKTENLKNLFSTAVFFSLEIPHFNEVLIMSTVCDACGWRNNEMKPSGGISEFGQTIELNIATPEDLSRDVIKVFLPCLLC